LAGFGKTLKELEAVGAKVVAASVDALVEMGFGDVANTGA